MATKELHWQRLWFFLDWHEIEINDPGEELYSAMIGLAQKNLDKAGLTKLFQKLAKQVEK